MTRLLITTVVSDDYLEIFRFWLAHHAKLTGAEVHVLLDNGAPKCAEFVEKGAWKNVFLHCWNEPFSMEVYRMGIVEMILKKHPHTYHLTLDVDEFWESDAAVERAIRWVREQGANYVRCYFVDRFAANGEIISLKGVRDIFASFPLETKFSAEIIKACAVKCAFAKSGIYGGHAPEYWMLAKPVPTRAWMPLHHFRYYKEAEATNEKKIGLFLKDGWGQEYVAMKEVLANGLRDIERYVLTDLEKLAVAGNYATDKHTLHTYLRAYAWRLRHLVGTPCKLLEIGVQRGGSLALWRDWLGPMAEITGIDVELATPMKGVKIIRADAYAIETIERFSDLTYDVIIDDGSHNWRDVAAAIVGYYPKLKPGGFLFIEDEGPWSRHFPLLKKMFPRSEMLDFSRQKGEVDKLFVIRKPLE